jgi:hypothetical protein
MNEILPNLEESEFSISKTKFPKKSNLKQNDKELKAGSRVIIKNTWGHNRVVFVNGLR